MANALEWAKELATYVESSNALSHSYVGGDQVLGVHDFFGKEGGRVGQVFKNAANIQATESELYEACDPEAFTPEDWVEDWVKQANRRHRDLVKNSQALQAIADSDPTQESKTPDQDQLLARLADPQSMGSFTGCDLWTMSIHFVKRYEPNFRTLQSSTFSVDISHVRWVG